MRHMKLYGLMVLAMIFLSVNARAQSQDSASLKRELTLEKEYAPTIRDASRITIWPEMREPEASKTPVEFAKYSVPYDIAPQLITLPAGSFFTDLPFSKKRGYLKAGVGSFIDIDGDAGYQILNSEKDRLSIFGSHRSSNGKVAYLQDDTKQKMKLNDNLAGLDYVHDFGGMRLNLNTKYTYSAFNYYGFTMPDNGPVLVSPVYVIDKDINQVNNLFEIGAGFINDKPQELNYSLHLGFTSFGQKYAETDFSDGQKESRFLANLDVHKEFNSNMLIGVGGDFKNYSYSSPDDYFTLGDGYGNLGLNPYFGIDGGNWNARLGLKVNLIFGSDDNNHNIAPDIRFNFYPVEKVRLYLALEGGVQDNGLYQMFYENRYVDPILRITDSRSMFDGTFGVKASPMGNFTFDLFTGFKRVNDDHFFLTAFPVTVRRDDPVTALGGGMIVPAIFDANVFKLGGSLSYKYMDLFDLSLKATYYNCSVSSDADGLDPDLEKPWNRPDFVTDLTLGYNVGEIPLRLEAAYHLETGRKSYANYETVGMKNINNLTISGNYIVNDTFSIFARANNLLFQKYDLFYGYPAQNFGIMGGISVRF